MATWIEAHLGMGVASGRPSPQPPRRRRRGTDGYARHSLVSRIVVPTMVALLVMPTVACVVFINAAKESSYQDASRDMSDLQSLLLPLMESQPVDDIVPDSADGAADDAADMPEQDAELDHVLLTRLSRAAHSVSGSARAMVLADDMRLVYPSGEQERDSTSTLADEMIAALGGGSLRTDGTTVTWRFSEGEYLVQAYDVLGPEKRMGYLVTYCKTNRIDDWVSEAGGIVWGVSTMLALSTAAVLWLTARNVGRQLDALGAEARRMGDGDFTPIKGVSFITELQNLGTSLNDMAHHLEMNDRAQKDFFQNVSHELRSPLMSIGGYAQGLEQGVFDDPKQAARTILEESGRLGELVDDLLTLSRMESGDRQARRESVAVADAVDDAIDRFRGLAMRGGVTLGRGDIPADLSMLGDEELVGRILDNLLSNAIRYARSAVLVETRVACDAAGAGEARARVAIIVRDDGDGIDAEDMPHLFERCYKGRGGHFGLGLSIAQAAADAMDGTLEATNAPDRGAVFTLTLARA